MEINTRYNGVSYSNFDPAAAVSAGMSAEAVVSAVHGALSELIDSAAGQARASFVSPGSYIDKEYLLAKQEAQGWLDGGKDEAAIPSSVSDHMAMFGVGAEAAATEIVATAEQWEQALATVRSARLGGKAAVRSAETIEAAEQAAKAAIAELNAIRPPEGSL